MKEVQLSEKWIPLVKAVTEKKVDLSKVVKLLKAEDELKLTSDKGGFNQEDVEALELNLLQAIEIMKDRDTSVYKESGVRRTLNALEHKDKGDNRGMATRLNDIVGLSNQLLGMIKK